MIRKLHLAIKVMTLGAMVGLVAWGSFELIRSSRFQIQMVEWDFDPGIWRKLPVSEEALQSRVRPFLEQQSLFEVKLDQVYQAVADSPWIDQVRVSRRFPNKLAINVQMKIPVAIEGTPDGRLVYLDTRGKQFGEYRPRLGVSLPLISFPSKEKGSQEPSVALEDDEATHFSRQQWMNWFQKTQGLIQQQDFLMSQVQFRDGLEGPQADVQMVYWMKEHPSGDLLPSRMNLVLGVNWVENIEKTLFRLKAISKELIHRKEHSYSVVSARHQQMVVRPF